MSTLTPGKSTRTLIIPKANGHFLKQLKNLFHNLLVAIWQDQFCVQGRGGWRAASIFCYTALSNPLPLPRPSSTLAFERTNATMPSPRRVIGSHTRPILLVAAAVVVAQEAAKGSCPHESQQSQWAELACDALRLFCVTDEVLEHHWEQPFEAEQDEITWSWFPIDTCHKPTCQQQTYKSRHLNGWLNCHQRGIWLWCCHKKVAVRCCRLDSQH